MRNIKEVFERYNFSVEKQKQGYFISQYTPAGEDWGFTLENLEDIKDYAENFDPDEEFDMWMEARHRVRGVPSPHDLWEDQIWKQNMLKNVANEV